MRRKMQQIICWLHATLIFALIAPFLYALDFSEELRNTGQMCIRDSEWIMIR